MQEHETDMDTLIAKWVRDELTVEESAEFDAWRLEHTETFDELRELKEIWQKYGRFKISRRGKDVRTWSRIAKRIRNG